MSFVQAGFLIACAAAAIPVLVHLLNRWQVRSLELGTMRFLHEVIHDGAQRRKIRRWLLLATRVALVILLALLFARPFFPERSRRDGDRLRIVLIDRSASMGMPGQNGRLIDDAVAAAVDAAADMGRDAKVLWAWFDHQVQPLDESATRPTAPRVVVGDTDYLQALAWARDRVNAYPAAIADVVLVTDLQQSGLAAEQLAADSLAFPADVPVRIIDVGRPAANNLAITGVSVPDATLDAQQDCVAAVTLFNFGTLPFEGVPLTASAFDGQRTVRLKKSVDVPGGQAQEVSMDLGQLDPGAWQITVALDVGDDLAADNRRLTAVQVAQPAKVLVLDSGSRGDGAAAESYFLTTALEQSNRGLASSGEQDRDRPPRPSRFDADVVFMRDESVRGLDPKSHPLVIAADAGTFAPLTIQQLEQYVRLGGKLLVFAGDGLAGDAPLGWQQSGLAPGELGVPQRSGVMPFRIVPVSGRGAMLQPFDDPQHGDLGRLAFQKLLPVKAAESTDVLAWFDHNRPAVTQHPLGEGRVVWFLSSADASWGSWTLSPLYLPLVQQMAADLLNLTGEGPIRFRFLGDPQPLPRRSTRSDTAVVPASLSGASQPADSMTFAQPGFVRRPDALYVINGLEKESDPTRIPPAALAERFGLTLAGAADVSAVKRVDSESRNELWPWWAAAVVLLCVGEFTLANRTSA